MGNKLYNVKCVSSFVIKDDMLHTTLTLQTVNVDAFAASAYVSHYYYMYTKLLLNVYPTFSSWVVQTQLVILKYFF